MFLPEHVEDHAGGPYKWWTLTDLHHYWGRPRASGHPTILVHIAGVMVPATLESATEEMYHLAFDVHVLGALLGTQATLAAMRSAVGRSIVIMSSAAGIQGVVGLAMYGVSKAAKVHIARTAALELGRYGIRVNAIAPGLIDTKMSRSIMPPSDHDEAGGVDDDKRLHQTAPCGQVKDVAPAVLYLASDESKFVIGTLIPIDGGHLAGTAAPLPGEG